MTSVPICILGSSQCEWVGIASEGRLHTTACLAIIIAHTFRIQQESHVVHICIYLFVIVYCCITWKRNVSTCPLLVNFSVFYEGREQSQFCLPLVENRLVLWLWVEITKGLLWVLESDMRKI